MNNTLNISKDTSLGELIIHYPGITEKLNELQIDYCCQGDRTLGEVVAAGEISEDFIEEAKKGYESYLQEPDKETPVNELTDIELIDLILYKHHQKERNLWTELDKMVNKILRVHYDHGKEQLLELHRAFATLKMELEEHFVKEEAELFPLMEEENKTPEQIKVIADMVAELESDHDAVGDLLKDIIRITNGFTAPEYACNTVLAVFAKLHELTDDIFLHVAKENSVLFKRYLV